MISEASTATIAALRQAMRHAEAWHQAIDEAPVGATASLETLRARFDPALSDQGLPADRIIDELVAATRDGLHATGGGRFFAWVIGSALPSALAADLLATVWDQNPAMFTVAPAASVIEEVAGSWLKQALGLPADASFALTTGCQMAHATCLAAARNGMLARAGWDVEADGLVGAPPVRILANDQRHGSVERALRLLGFGARALTPIATDGGGRILHEDFSRALSHIDGPCIVVLNAADLNVGGCDDFGALIPEARARGAWVHIDGAFGLWARASARRRHLVQGVELADSWATDGHKWLNTPRDSGMAFVRHSAAHRAAMTISASYLVAGGDARDPIDWTPDWSRRARGFAVYAALRELGREGLAAMIDRCCDHATALAEGIGALPGAELVARPTLNQALVRFLDPRPGAAPADHDRHTDAMIVAINATGAAFFSGTSWQGRRAMRISVCSWRTSQADVRLTIAGVERALRGLVPVQPA